MFSRNVNCVSRLIRPALNQYSTDMASSASVSTSAEIEEKYQQAVRTLNTLQSNAATLEKVRMERDALRELNLPHTLEYCARVGITESHLEKLSVIHVTGTKGKGSTCAFTESILRHLGYKTGFYSSPHLIEVRERIRIGGVPLTKLQFVSHFWEVYNKLEETKGHYEGRMPPYFRFLTVLALKVFLHEMVNVAIVEVGIGGRFDCTNVVKNPVVCAITSLGLDHTSVLGHDVESIAWQKAGIIKPGCQVITSNKQPGDSLQVLLNEAQLHKCPLYAIPPLAFPDGSSSRNGAFADVSSLLGIRGSVQSVNASLAVQAAHLWLLNHDKTVQERIASNKRLLRDVSKSNPLPPPLVQITPQLIEGLSNTCWAGRNQVVERENFTFYIDGAHTRESVIICRDWFESLGHKKRAKKVLLFNTTGDRNARSLLEPLSAIDFDFAVFCPNITSIQDDRAAFSSDIFHLVSMKSTQDSIRARCEENQSQWLGLTGHPAEQTMVFSSVSEALDWLHASLGLGGRDPVHVLVTGSLHLVGTLLKVIQPDLND